jgi:hypothetical protein
MGKREAKGRAGPVTAAEIACFAYCPEQWRLQYGLGVRPENRASLDGGTRHHRSKAAAETVAGGLIRLGWWLAVIALVSMDPNRYEVSEPELLRGLRLS